MFKWRIASKYPITKIDYMERCMDITKKLINYTDEVDRKLELRYIEFGEIEEEKVGRIMIKHLKSFYKVKRELKKRIYDKVGS